MPVSRVRSEELGRWSGGRVSSRSLPPRRPPPGLLPGGSRRRSAAVFLGRAVRPGPGPPSERGFLSPPSPREGAEAAAKQRYQSPPREEEESDPESRPPADPQLLLSLSLPPRPAGVGGGGRRIRGSGRRAQTSSVPEVGTFFSIGKLRAGPRSASGRWQRG